jgi:hypothetical protein
VADREGFGIVLESGWDRAMPYCEAAYTRYFEREHIPLQEDLFPWVRLSTTVVAEDDRPMVNNALRHGHVICLEPRYYHGSLAGMSRLAEYIREVVSLRKALRSLLWDGRPVERDDVHIEGDVLAGVFEDGSGSGQLAVVLCHFEREARRSVVDVGGDWIGADLFQPFREPMHVNLPVDVQVLPDEYVVIVPRPRLPPGS